MLLILNFGCFNLFSQIFVIEAEEIKQIDDFLVHSFQKIDHG